MLVAVHVLLAALAAHALDPFIGVVEELPERALLLDAVVRAALGEGAGEGEGEGEGAGAGEAETGAAVEPGAPLALAARVCALAAAGAAAGVAGGGLRAASLAAGSAARAGLPLLLVDPAPPAAAASWEVLELYPHSDVLAAVGAELCRAKGWQRAVLLHEGSARGAARLAPDPGPLVLLARQLPPERDPALLRNLLLVLKKQGWVNFLVWCSPECSVRVLDAAQRVGLLSSRHSYIVLSLDLHTQTLANYSHGGANITSLRLVDPESNFTDMVVSRWREHLSQIPGRRAAEGEEPAAAVMLGAGGARLAGRALRYLQLPALPAADCARGAGAFHADTLLNYLRSSSWGGMSWSADGGRREVALRVVELARGGRLAAAGRWAPRSSLRWERAAPPAPPPPPDSMTNRTFTVLIAMSQPYVMRKESPDRLTGNDRYEGFCIELIERLAQQLNFNYTFEEATGSYGTYDNITHKWTGMIHRLMTEDDIDFAITDLTITAERESAVDFTTPFMNLGISILFRTPKAPEPQLFAFLLPFSNGVWLGLGLAYLGTSLLLYVVGRLCHEEWQNPYPCIEEPLVLENQFTLANALWFNLGAVLLQGSEIAPVAYSTRAVASVWWLFALVITSSYTANLATLLAKKTSDPVISSVEDLAKDELNIKYGAKELGSTYTFFQNSKNNSLYEKMARNMAQEEMPKSNDEGINKVMEEDYAFFMESTSIEYVIERNCKVTMVGGLLDSKGYGIAMKKDSQYRQALNLALLNLQEAGILREMKYTWWKEKHGGGSCLEEDDRASTELSMRNFVGLFLVLVVGCALGVLVSCCDLAWAAARRPRDPTQPFTRRFWDELRFVFRFHQSVKPLQGTLSESSSESPRSESANSELGSGSEQRGSEEHGERGSGDGRQGERRASSQRPGTGAGRRRSSMHAASVRLARHARDASTPAPRR